jgi:CDP-glucose 4,6-dehydratase
MADGSSFGAPDRSFWRGRRVLVTGHTGFKGSWLALWLRSLGAEVTGYALEPPSEPSLYDQARVSETLRDVRADVRDHARLSATIADARPEVVLHMAAQSVVKRGYADPVETYSANVMGTVHLLEAVRTFGKGCAVVNVTSDKCYAPRSTGPGYRETDPMGGDDPYSSSKGCSELVTTAYRHSFFPPDAWSRHGVALSSARAGNVIGGGDWTADRIIPDLMRAYAAGNACLVRNPGSIRPWQFVLEALRGYLLLAERLAKGEASFMSGWNFGPADDDAKPVSWIADRLKRTWGAGAAWIVDARAHPSEAAVLRLDASRSVERLGWRAALSLEQAMDWTVEWYLGWHRGEDLARLTMSQVERYEQLLSPVPRVGAPTR